MLFIGEPFIPRSAICSIPGDASGVLVDDDLPGRSVVIQRIMEMVPRLEECVRVPGFLGL